MPRGVSEADFCRISTTCPRGALGTLGPLPAQREKLPPRKVGIDPRNRRSDGLSAMPGLASDCSPRLLLRGATLQVDRRPISEVCGL
jgi:hypothetical protein